MTGTGTRGVTRTIPVEPVKGAYPGDPHRGARVGIPQEPVKVLNNGLLDGDGGLSRNAPGAVGTSLGSGGRTGGSQNLR